MKLLEYGGAEAQNNSDYFCIKLYGCQLLEDAHKREWVKCVTRTRVRIPAVGIYESVKNLDAAKQRP